MIKFINENLFSFATKKEKNNFGEFYRTNINTSLKILQNDVIKGETKPMIRTIASIFSPEDDYGKMKMSVNIRTNDYGKSSVRIKADNKNRFDANLFVIAFPFNGIIKPIPESKQYRIYKGLISMSSDYSVSFNNKKYKKVFYLLIEPNMNLFKEEHEYHTDSIQIDFESFTLTKDKNNQNSENKTAVETMKFIITKDGTSTEWDKKVVDQIDTNQFRDMPLYTTYVKKEKGKEATTERPQTHKTMIKTRDDNSKRFYNTAANPESKPQDLESMMKSAFKEEKSKSKKRSFSFYKDEDDDRPTKRHGNKGKKSKNKKR